MPTTVGTESPRLSIIVPARNEAHSLPSSLESIETFLAESGFEADVIIVDNGSTDGTSDTVREFANRHKGLRIDLIIEPCLTRGAAALAGILRGTGDLLFICEASRSRRVKELKELKKFLTRLAIRRDIAKGCREATRHVIEPIHRRLMNFLFRGFRKRFD